MLEHPIRGDVALIKAHVADTRGNLVYRKTARNFGPVMATAATTTVVQVDRVVEAGELDPEAVVTPGIFVDRVVVCPATTALAGKERPDDPRAPRPRTAEPRRAGPAGRRRHPGRVLRQPRHRPAHLVADHLPPERGVVLHTENGMLGMGPAAHGDEIDPDLINAGKIPVTELPGRRTSTTPTRSR